MTFEELIKNVRRRADMEFSTIVSDEEVGYYINSSATELHDILVTKFEDYYITGPVDVTVLSGSTFELPSDFYKLKGLDVNLEGHDYAMHPFQFRDRHKYNNTFATRLFRNYDKRYRILGNTVHITPGSDATGNYKLWYVPKFASLVDPSDELNVIGGWEEYVIVDAAIKCLQKEESDPTILLAQKQALFNRIEVAAANRDVGASETVVDVHNWDWVPNE